MMNNTSLRTGRHPWHSRLLLMLLVCLFSSVALAQKLSVSKCEPTNQIVAGDDRLLDYNNEACALVKLQGAEVDSVAGAFRFRRKGTETWAYLTKGGYRLTLFKRGYESVSVNLHDYNIDGVESNRVYMLVVSLPTVGIQPQAKTANYMTLWVTPKTAAVTIDGQLCTVDPEEGTVNEVLTFGMHTLQVQAPGYETVTRNINFAEDSEPLHINLQSMAAEVVIRATTPGTLISVNNEDKGLDNCTVRLSPRTYIIKGTKPGCQTQELTITITNAQPREVTIPALLEMTGTVNIRYKPTGSEIRIDGKAVGNSPRIIPGLSVGQHTVEIRRDGYRTYRGTVNIELNTEAALTGTLERGTDMPYTVALRQETPAGVVAVDLGLPSGTLWANMNVGARRPEDYGHYFAWGETRPKDDYTWKNYIHCDDSSETCHDLGSDIADTEYDAATVNWGSPWKMPTREQVEELINNCPSEWTRQNGVYGRRFTSRNNGASIFLPAAGGIWDGESYFLGSGGGFWSSTPNDENLAFYLYFNSGRTRWFGGDRRDGRSVRPVVKN